MNKIIQLALNTLKLKPEVSSWDLYLQTGIPEPVISTRLRESKLFHELPSRDAFNAPITRSYFELKETL